MAMKTLSSDQKIVSKKVILNNKLRDVLVFSGLSLLSVGTYFISDLFKKDLVSFLPNSKHDVVDFVKDANEIRKLSDVRVYDILNKHDDKVVGFDVSEYQGIIDWQRIKTIEGTFPLEFVFIRATCGINKEDKKFDKNWAESKENKITRGAYHYYRPDENAVNQAKNFIKTVQLKKGDLPPVLDIEKMPKRQSMAMLKMGLKRWLGLVELHYGVRPIIYTGESYYNNFLKNDFKGYTFWIANYSTRVSDVKDHWLFWQFSDRARINGIKGNVDVNVFNGQIGRAHV